MADKKISQLTAATTPLAGTEVLPIVQGTTTVKVANNDLRPKQIQSNATSGVLQVTGPGASTTRVMTVPDANFTAARTDSAQTFTGVQTLSSNPIISVGSNGCVLYLDSSKQVVSSSNLSFDGTTFLTGSGTTGKCVVNGAGGTGPCTFEIWGGGSGNPYWDWGTSSATNKWSLGYTFSGSRTNYLDIQSGNLTLNNGNFIVGTSGKGIDFSATASGSGTMTSELLADYEEGIWTPGFGSWSANPTTVYATYTKVGRVVTLNALFFNGTTTGGAYISGIPYVTGGSDGAAVGMAITATDPSVQFSASLVNYSSAISHINAITIGSNYWSFSITYNVS